MLLIHPCYSTELVDEQAKISIWYPDTWNMQSDDENTVLITDPHEDVVVIYRLVETNKLETALEVLETQLNGLAGDLRAAEEPEEDELNGMKCILLDVMGKIKKTNVRISIIIIFTPGQKILLVTAMTESTKFKKYEETISKIIMGIKHP
jgi:hypothetical protein